MLTVIQGFLENKVLFAAILGWFLAQVLKLILTSIATRRLKLERLWGAGGMPSAHSAMVCAMTIAAARFYSINSPAFAFPTLSCKIVLLS